MTKWSINRNLSQLSGFVLVVTLPIWKGDVRGSNPHLFMGDWGGDEKVLGMGFDSHVLQEARQKSESEY